jgi:hypothetical protein
LNLTGYEAYVTAKATNPAFRTPVLTPETIQRHAQAGITPIAVYPEVVTGNPLNARIVARWVLNRPGLLGGEKVYDPGELVFYYSEVYLGAIQNKVQGRLFISNTNDSLFFYDAAHPPESRTLECFYVGKSSYKAGYFDPDKAFEITRSSPTRKNLGVLLRSARVLYCFDNSTALVLEAALCGCAVVIIADGTQSRAAIEKTEFGMNGILWWEGAGRIPRESLPIVDVAAIAECLAQVRENSKREIAEFARITQQARAF